MCWSSRLWLCTRRLTDFQFCHWPPQRLLEMYFFYFLLPPSVAQQINWISQKNEITHSFWLILHKDSLFNWSGKLILEYLLLSLCHTSFRETIYCWAVCKPATLNKNPDVRHVKQTQLSAACFSFSFFTFHLSLLMQVIFYPFGCWHIQSLGLQGAFFFQLNSFKIKRKEKCNIGARLSCRICPQTPKKIYFPFKKRTYESCYFTIWI